MSSRLLSTNSTSPAGYQVAFQANTGALWTVGTAGNTAWSLGIKARTSSSIAVLSTGGFEVAVQTNGGDLWTIGQGPGAQDIDWHLGMAPGTSPSITALPGGGFQVAFEANTGALWTVGSAGDQNWGLGMAAGTSPSITALPGGGFQVAFEANTGALWTVGSAGDRNWGLGMAAGTSPSITAVPGAGFEAAFQANTTALWTVGSAGARNWGLGMAAGTSPSITAVPGAGFEAAFQANTTALWTVGSAGDTNWGLGMEAGTSPSITAVPGAGFEAAFQANTTALWTVGSAGDTNWGLGMRPETSPSLSAAAPLAGKVIAIDPGHNGGNAAAPGIINQLVWNGREWEPCDTTGTETNSGYTEAQFNFNVAQYLAADLEAEGATVVFTRTSNTGVGPCVTVRAAIGNNAHANAAISIHADGGPPAGRGFAILEPVADGPNDAIVAPSQALGLDIRSAFLGGTGEPVSTYDGINGIQPRDDLAGLNLSTVPKVLVECANMRNPTDAGLLTTTQWQETAARALAAGLTFYLM